MKILITLLLEKFFNWLPEFAPYTAWDIEGSDNDEKKKKTSQEEQGQKNEVVKNQIQTTMLGDCQSDNQTKKQQRNGTKIPLSEVPEGLRILYRHL